MAEVIQYDDKTVIRLSGGIYCCDFSKSNFLAFGTGDKMVSVWELTPIGFEQVVYSPLMYHDYPLISLTFTKDGNNLVSTSTDGRTNVFNVKTGVRTYNIVQSMGGGVRMHALWPGLPYLTTVTDEGHIFIWSLESYQILRLWQGHDTCICSVAISPDTLLLTSGDSGGTLKLWILDRAMCLAYPEETFLLHHEKDLHDGAILAMACSPHVERDAEGDRIYIICTGGDDDVLKLWKAKVKLPGGECLDFKVQFDNLKKFKSHTRSITCIKFSSDGKLFASTSLDGSARIWEVATLTCTQKLFESSESVFCCSFSPKTDFFVTGSHKKLANIWASNKEDTDNTLVQAARADEEGDKNDTGCESEATNELQVLTLDCGVNSVDLNSDNALVVGCCDSTVRIYSFSRGVFSDPTNVLKHKYYVTSVEFSPSGKSLMTVSNDGVILLNCSTSDGKTVSYHLRDQFGEVARFSPVSEQMAIASSYGKLYLFSTESNIATHSYRGHSEAVKCLAFSPDGEYLASGCLAGIVMIWRTNPPVPTNVAFLEDVHDLGVTTCDFSHSFSTVPGSSYRVYRLATGGYDGLLRLYTLQPEDELSVKPISFLIMRGHGCSISQVRFSNNPPDILASVASDRTARLWNTDTGECLNILDHHKTIVTTCAFSSDDSFIVTGSLDKTLKVWKVPSLSDDETEKTIVDQLQGLQLDEACAVDKGYDEGALSLDDLVIGFNQNSLDIPHPFLCPITRQIMTDPVICSDGCTYERSAITAWINNGRMTSPLTNEPLTCKDVLPDRDLQAALRRFLLEKKTASKN